MTRRGIIPGVVAALFAALVGFVLVVGSGGAVTADPAGCKPHGHFACPTPPPTSSTTTSPTTTTTTSPTTTTITTPPVGQLCTNPYFITSGTNDGTDDGGFYVHNNLWNVDPYPGAGATLEVCSYRSWNSVATANNFAGDGAVKMYPNVHKDLTGRTIASFAALGSRFAMVDPGDVGIYNVAYDFWINGIPNEEVMIWTDNYRQVPAGTRVAGVTLSGVAWDVFATTGDRYIAFVPAGGVRVKAGTLDLLGFLEYLVSTGRHSASDTVDQVGFGIEVVDTGNVPRTWNLTDFSLSE